MELNIFGKHVHVKKETIVVIASFLMVLLGLTGYALANRDKGIVIIAEKDEKDTSGTEEFSVSLSKDKADSEEPKETNEEIKVYVTGCVHNPGIVTLKKGQLIDDAIKAAGGATEEADLENINLVFRLNDNVMLRICSKNENRSDKKTGEGGSGIEIVKDSGGAVVNGGENKEAGIVKININTATASELDTLPGIGEATAREIIAFREKHGPFKKIEDIMKIPGIKENRFNSIKDYITVD